MRYQVYCLRFVAPGVQEVAAACIALVTCVALDTYALPPQPVLHTCLDVHGLGFAAVKVPTDEGQRDDDNPVFRLTDLLQTGQLDAVIDAVDNDRLLKKSAIALSIQAIALQRAGYLKRAVEVASTANELALLTTDKSVHLSARMNVATVIAKAGLHERARDLLEGVARASEAAGLSKLQAQATANLARIGIDNEVFAAGQARRAESIAAEKLSERDRMDILLSLGETWLELAKRQPERYSAEAIQMLTRTYQVASATRNRAALSQVLAMMAAINTRLGNYSLAQELIDRAITMFAGSDMRTEVSLTWQKAKGQRLLGHIDASIQQYRRAIDQLQRARAEVELALAAQGGTFRGEFGALYAEYADLLLLHARSDAATSDSILREARDVLEQSKAVELADYFRDPCIGSAAQRATSAENADPGAAILYPIVMADRIELLLSYAGTIEQIIVPIERARVLGQIQLFRGLLEKRTTRQFLRPSHTLYQWLIAPVLGRLEKIKPTTLVIVPDSVLGTIPFAALHDGKAFLVERYALAVTPSLSLTNPRALSKTAWHPLLNGLTVASQGFSALPGVADELSALEVMLNVPSFRDREFSQLEFERRISSTKANIVHIASHGQFGSDVNDTFLLTYDGKLTLTDLRKAISAGKAQDEPLELLSLSACQTAAGDDRAALGLAGVAIQAGARSAFASLWFVNDESASELVTRFYSGMRQQDGSKASALQRAQKSMLQDERYSHPAYWAAFLIIGNWL